MEERKSTCSNKSKGHVICAKLQKVVHESACEGCKYLQRFFGSRRCTYLNKKK